MSKFWSVAAVSFAAGVGGFGGGASGATIFVDASRMTGANDGTSWANAFQGRLGLVSALAAANPGDEVWVADGVYAPAPASGDRNLSFAMRDGVAVLGGFAGDETNAEQRDPALNIAVLTGDLNSNDGPPVVGITPNSDDNSRHVVRFENVVGAALDGFTVRAGLAEGPGGFVDWCGGNVRVVGGEAALANCVIENGRAQWAGGGVAVVQASATITDCVIREHRGDNFGSGLAALDESDVLVEDTVFDANYCGQGAGIYIGTLAFNDPDDIPGAVTILRSVFQDGNGIISSPFGGAIYSDGGALVARECVFESNFVQGGGGAMYLRSGSARVDRCDFVGNDAPGDGGGAVFVDGSGGQEAPVLFTNSRFVGNNGAFVVNFAGVLRVVNCSVVNNGIGVPFLLWPAFFVSPTSAAMIENTIVWGNVTGGTFGSPNINLVGSGTYSLANNVIEHWTMAMGPGAVGDDPTFVDLDGVDGLLGTDDDDLRLLPGSVARDAGDNAALPMEAMLDLIGAARVIDGDNNGAPVVDLGAIEMACLGDANGDGVVDFGDLNAVLSVFGAGSGTGADMNFDGAVDFSDLNAVLSAFGADCR